jgi:hypothetical protein
MKLIKNLWKTAILGACPLLLLWLAGVAHWKLIAFGGGLAAVAIVISYVDSRRARRDEAPPDERLMSDGAIRKWFEKNVGKTVEFFDPDGVSCIGSGEVLSTGPHHVLLDGTQAGDPERRIFDIPFPKIGKIQLMHR